MTITIDKALSVLKLARKHMGGDACLILSLSGSELEDVNVTDITDVHDGDNRYVEVRVSHPALDKAGAPQKVRPNPATFSVPPLKGQRKVTKTFGGMKIEYVHRSEVAVKGDARFIATTDGFFGCGRNYGSANTLHNPTWGQVFALFKESIPVTGDYHHCYLEGISPLNKKAQDGCPLYEFITGS